MFAVSDAELNSASVVDAVGRQERPPGQSVTDAVIGDRKVLIIGASGRVGTAFLRLGAQAGLKMYGLLDSGQVSGNLVLLAPELLQVGAGKRRACLPGKRLIMLSR